MADLIQIGSVSSVNPARREVRIEVAKSYTPLLKDMAWLHVMLPGDEKLKSKVVSIRPNASGAIIKLAAGVPRDTIARMLKAKVILPESEAKRSTDTYDPAELEGFHVINRSGVRIGQVTAVFETEAHGVLEVDVPGADSVLIPAVPELIDRIDWKTSEILIGEIDSFLNPEDDDNPTAVC